MVSPDYQAGVVYEPTLSAGIRSLNLIGGGAAAVILTPAYEANLIPGLKETETFQLAKSGEILDQFALNMVNATDVMDYYKNNELIVAGMDSIMPGYGQSIATGMGFFASAMNPYAGPGLILKYGSKPIVGYAKTMAAKNVVDNMLRTAAVKNADGGVLTAKEIIDQELNPTLSYWLSNVERNDLNDLASERVAEHLSAATTIRAGLDANGSISAKELGDIAATPTGVAIINNAIKKDMEPFYKKVGQNKVTAEHFVMFKNDLPSWHGSADGPVLTRQNSGDYVSSLLQPYKEAAKTNRAVARIYNESQAALRMSREALELTGEAKRINTDSLTTEFQNEVIRSRLAKEIGEGNVSLDELAKVIKSARNEDGVLTGEAISKLGLKYDTTTASLSDMFVGLRNTLKTPLRERLLNFLPTNLKVVASDTVIDVSKDQTKKFLKNKNFKAHLNNLRNKQKSIDFKDDSYIITNNKVRNEIVKDVIDYYGADRIRQSEGLRSLLNNLLDNKITLDDRILIDNAIQSQSAIKHLGAFRLREAGEQYTRAARPEEFRGDLIDLSRKDQQLSKGYAREVARDIRNLFKAIKSSPEKKNLQFDEGVKPSIEFVELQKELNNLQDMLVENTKKEFQELTKKAGNPVRALNIMGEQTLQKAVKSQEIWLDRTVKDNFDGDYVEYISTMTNEADQAYLLGRVKQGDDPRAVALDYNTYFVRIDALEAMLRRYMGERKYNDLYGGVDRKSGGMARRDLFMPSETQRIAEGFVEGAKARTRYAPVASNVMKPTYSNLLIIVDKIKNKYPTVKLLRTRTGKAVPTVPYMEWILGVRRGAQLSAKQAAWIDRNPRFRVSYYPSYTNLNMEIDLNPLANQYKKMFENAVVAFTRNGYSIDPDKQREIIDKWAPEMAQLHYDTVRRVSVKEREEIVKDIDGLMRNQNTLSPSFNVADKDFRVRHLSFVKKTIDNEMKKVMANAVKGKSQIPFPGGDVQGVGGQGKSINQILEDMRGETWNMMFNPPPADGRYFGDPAIGILQDMMDNVQQFYRANGMTINNSLPETLTMNAPMFARIRDTNYGAVYGTELSETFATLNDLAKTNKLEAMMTSLTKADDEWSQWLAGTVLDAVSWGRRSMTQGMLGGFPFPNGRYLGMNILTAPFIMLGTLGLSRTWRSLTRGAGIAISKPFKAGSIKEAMKNALCISQIPDNAVVFTSMSGRKYTAKELRLLEDANNLGLSRGRVEFYEGQATELLEGTAGARGVKLTGEPVSGWNVAGKNLNPTRRNLWSKFADSSDHTYRRATFYSALKDDMPIEQAVALAKRSVLDYGAMSQTEKQFFNRAVMFWSFTRQIHAETINALGKSVLGNAGPNYLASVMRSSMKQINGAGSWFNSDDSVHGRLFAWTHEEEDKLPSMTYGPTNPYVEVFNTFTNIAMLVADENRMQAALDYLINSRQRPVLNVLKQSVSENVYLTVPSDIVYAFKALPGDGFLWNQLVTTYKIEKVTQLSKMRRQAPIFDGEQYRFKTKQDRLRFEYAMLFFTVLGVTRNFRDISKTTMATGYVPEGQNIELKRFQDPNALMYWLGMETSIEYKDLKDIINRNQNKITNDMKQLYRESR